MYVFYPASRLVGLTINYREINQACPFPPRNPFEESESENHFNANPSNDWNERRSRSRTLEASDNQESKSDCFQRKSVSPCPGTNKSQSESPTSPPEKPPRRKKLGKNSREVEKSPETISLEENLKNLKVYQATKPNSLKRSWSLHFKKAVTADLVKMAALECTLREMTHPALNDTLKSHNAVTFKLVKTVSEFTESLAHIYEQHAEEMQLLVSNFRKKNSELRKERPACASSLFHAWETLLQEVEIDSQAHTEIASILGRQVSRPLLEKSFFRKIQSRKVFSHRETYENAVKQAEEKLGKTRIEYKTAYLAYMNGPSTQTLANYIASHNEYVAQLHLTNGLLSHYHSETLPTILQEIEDIYNDLCVKISDSVLQVAEMISSRAQEQCKRYEGLTAQCRSVQGPTDLTHLVRSVTIPGNHPPVRRHFTAPQPPPQMGPDGQPLPPDSSANANLPPALKNEIVLDRLTSGQVRERYESAKKECSELETQTKQLSDALHTLTRVQQRSIDSNLFNKVNELQEDISVKQHELNMTLIRLAGIKAQKELFSNKIESAETGRERKMSSSSTGSMKSKWMKALKSLKTPPANGTAAKEAEKKNQMYHAVSTILAMRKNGKEGGTTFSHDSTAHVFQDYTYKKITPCDVCSQVLRGHTRQGLKCRVCKLNVHVDCQDKAPKCQQKSRLLRRQKSTSEIDTKIQEPPLEEETVKPLGSGPKQVQYEKETNPLTSGRLSPPENAVERLSQQNIDAIEVDQVYQVLKQASDLSSKSSNPSRNLNAGEAYQNPSASPPSVSRARSDVYLEKTPSFERALPGERKGEYYYSNPKHSKSYSRSEYPPASDLYQAAEFYQKSPPKTYKNRLSDPGVIQLNNAACSGGSAGGTAASGPSCADSGSQGRRQQGPLLLRGSAPHSVGPAPVATSSAPHSPRRQKLNLRMKSLSLDSPESTEHAQKRRAQASHSAGHSSQSSSSKIHSPSSPVHNRRLLSARNMRMSSVELPDDNEKSLSSASTSPCPSPKAHRLLPTNLYVVLYNFKSRHPDELDLKAGYKVTVMDNSDPDWWKGKCLGRVGYFPSKYVIKLEPGERPLQVTHNLQVQDGDVGIMLLRDQIVIQVGEEVDGMVMIRSADNKQGACPVKFLQEV